LGASRKMIHAVAVAGSVLSLGVLLALAPRTSRQPERLDEVTLGVSTLRISLPLFLALKRDLFARHGLRVTVRSYPTAQPMVDDVTLGRIDAAGFAAWPIVLLASTRAPLPPRVATALDEDEAHRLSYVLGRRGTGLRFPRDVRGRRVGVLPTAAYRRWLPAVLRAAGIDPGAVTVVPVEPALQAQTLARGGVDMMFTNDPMATAMIARGLAEVIDDGPPCARRLGSPFGFGTFVLSGAFATRAPGVAARLVEAVDEAILATRADPGSARRAMAEYLRPEERHFVDAYPRSLYRTSRETGDAVSAEIIRERALGILDRDASVRSCLRPVP
jgi:ABC-type nitrate/sulfonate/bicarbonate transport system substrate-binding protein